MSNSSQVFENENFTATFTKYPACKYDLIVTIKPALKQLAQTEAIKNVSKEISMPGFRKGKVPHQWVMEKHKKVVEEEARDFAINKAVNDALNMAKIFPLRHTIKTTKVDGQSNQDDLSVKITFECYPQIPTIKVEEIKISAPQPSEITEKEINDRYRSILLQFAEFSPVNDRGIEWGDFVDFSFKQLKDGQVVRQFEQSKIEFISDTTMEELSQLLGMRVGEEKQIEVPTNPDNLTTEIKIGGIYTATLPEVDAKFLSQFSSESVEDLKNRVEARIAYEQKQEAHDLTRDAIVQKIFEIYPFEIPQSYVDSEIKDYTYRQHEQILQAGYTEEWIKQNQTQLADTIRPQAEGKVRLTYLSLQFAHDHKFSPDPKTVNQEVQRVKSMINNPQVKDELIREKVTQDILLNTMIEYLIKHIAVDEKTSNQ